MMSALDEVDTLLGMPPPHLIWVERTFDRYVTRHKGFTIYVEREFAFKQPFYNWKITSRDNSKCLKRGRTGSVERAKEQAHLFLITLI